MLRKERRGYMSCTKDNSDGIQEKKFMRAFALLRDPVQSSSLGIFKTPLGKALRNLI